MTFSGTGWPGPVSCCGMGRSLAICQDSTMMGSRSLGPIKGLNQGASTLVLAKDLKETGSLGAHDTA